MRLQAFAKIDQFSKAVADVHTTARQRSLQVEGARCVDVSSFLLDSRCEIGGAVIEELAGTKLYARCPSIAAEVGVGVENCLDWPGMVGSVAVGKSDVEDIQARMKA